MWCQWHAACQTQNPVAPAATCETLISHSVIQYGCTMSVDISLRMPYVCLLIFMWSGIRGACLHMPAVPLPEKSSLSGLGHIWGGFRLFFIQFCFFGSCFRGLLERFVFVVFFVVFSIKHSKSIIVTGLFRQRAHSRQFLITCLSTCWIPGEHFQAKKHQEQKIRNKFSGRHFYWFSCNFYFSPMNTFSWFVCFQIFFFWLSTFAPNNFFWWAHSRPFLITVGLSDGHLSVDFSNTLLANNPADLLSANQLIVVNMLFLENFRIEQIGSIAWVMASNRYRYRKVEET